MSTNQIMHEHLDAAAKSGLFTEHEMVSFGILAKQDARDRISGEYAFLTPWAVCAAIDYYTAHRSGQEEPDGRVKVKIGNHSYLCP